MTNLLYIYLECFNSPHPSALDNDLSGCFIIPTLFQPFHFNNPNSDYWKQVSDKDVGQSTSNPHIIAARIIKSGKAITASDVNSVLANQGLQVTQEELDQLVNLKPKVYTLTLLALINQIYPRGSGV